MNVIHSNVSLFESRVKTDGLGHVCVALTQDINVHVMSAYHNLEATASMHVWSHANGKAKLVKLTLTASEVMALVMERGSAD